MSVKKTVVAALLGVLGVTAAAWSFPTSQPEPVYIITYYTDSTFSQISGSIEQFCSPYGVAENALQGQITSYEDRFLVGYCDNGTLIWI